MNDGLIHILFRANGTLSDREKECPGTIVRLTGEMAMCEECCRNFRRMNPDKLFCGACQVPTVAGPGEIAYWKTVRPPGT